MMIGLIPMSAKPYHIGHDMLVNIASTECDTVQVYVSTSDRENVYAADMLKVWNSTIIQSLPANVTIQFVSNPSTATWNALENAELASSSSNFSIYSDDEDITRNYPEKSLLKYCGNLYLSKQVTLKGISRSQTVDISGTQMRQFLKYGDKANFIKNLPMNVDREAYWKALTGLSSIKRRLKL